MAPDRRHVSQLRQKIAGLREERKRIEDSLFRPGPMLRGSLSFIPNYCGKPECRCKRGHPHGPYPYVADTHEGRRRLTYVKKTERAQVEAEVAEYVRVQQGLASLAKLNARIRSCFEEIRDQHCRTVDELRRSR